MKIWISCPGWGDGRDGALCNNGYEASVWTGMALEPKSPCRRCGGIGKVSYEDLG